MVVATKDVEVVLVVVVVVAVALAVLVAVTEETEVVVLVVGITEVAVAVAVAVEVDVTVTVEVEAFPTGESVTSMASTISPATAAAAKLPGLFVAIIQFPILALRQQLGSTALHHNRSIALSNALLI